MDEGLSYTGKADTCGDAIDDNCNGIVNEGCECPPWDPDCCAKTRGRPVNVTTGITFTDPEVDVAVDTPVLPLTFARRYVAGGAAPKGGFIRIAW